MSEVHRTVFVVGGRGGASGVQSKGVCAGRRGWRDREDGKAKEGALAGRRVAWEALTTPGRTDDLSGLLLALEQIAHGLLHRAGAKRDAQQENSADSRKLLIN